MPRGRNVCIGVCLSALLLVWAPALSQDPPQKPPPVPPQEQEPAVRVTTRLVQVHVVARDRRGQPVRDLTADDFILLDRGRQEPVHYFATEVKYSRTPRAPSAPAGTFTNRTADTPNTAPATSTVILLDALNTPLTDWSFARDHLLKFLRELRPEDRVAVWALTINLQAIHDFTSDGASAFRAFEGFTRRQAHSIHRATNLAVLQNPAVAALRARMTLRALDYLSRRLSLYAGRKNLVWLGSSLPVTLDPARLSEMISARPEDELASRETAEVAEPDGEPSPAERDRTSLLRAFRAFNNANIAFYYVDARGLLGAIHPRSQIRELGSPRPPTFTTMSTVLTPIEGLVEFAENTGGLALFNTNDLRRAIRRATDDTEYSYVLGFYPSHGQWDSAFREITLRTTRRGVTLRYRKGYLATPDVAAGSQAPTATEFALLSPHDATSVALTVQAHRVLGPAPSAGDTASPGPRLKLSVHVDLHTINLERQAGVFLGELELLFSQTAASGEVVLIEGRQLDLRIPESEYERLRREGLISNWTLPLHTDARFVRVLVKDARSGAIGTVTVPLTSVNATAN